MAWLDRALYLPGQFWKGGAETFLHKGTKGRWRDILCDEEMALYDAACERTLTPECREWLECGEAVQAGSQSVASGITRPHTHLRGRARGIGAIL